MLGRKRHDAVDVGVIDSVVTLVTGVVVLSSLGVPDGLSMLYLLSLGSSLDGSLVDIVGCVSSISSVLLNSACGRGRLGLGVFSHVFERG